MPCPALPCPALPCPALPCAVLQCAHGRPTVAPIVDVPALRGLLAKLPHTNPHFQHSASASDSGKRAISSAAWASSLRRRKEQPHKNAEDSKMAMFRERKRGRGGAAAGGTLQQQRPVVEVSLRQLKRRISDARSMMQ